MALSASFLQSASSTTNTTAYTFSAQNLGTAAADRKILVVAYGADSAATFNVSTLTVNGVGATLVTANGLNATRETNNQRIEFWIADVPTGTSGDIVITWSEAIEQCAYSAYRFTDASSTPFMVSTASSTLGQMGADENNGGPIPGGSYTITALSGRFGTTNVDITWNADITEDADVYINEGSGNDGNFGTGHYDRISSTDPDFLPSYGGTITGGGSNCNRVSATFIRSDITGHILHVNEPYNADGDDADGTDITITFSTTAGEPQVVEGDVVLVSVFNFNGLIGPGGDGYPVTAGYTSVEHSLGNLVTHYKQMGASPDANVVIENNSSGSDIAVVVHVLRGVDATVIDATPTHDTGVDGPSITTVTDNAWVFVFQVGDTDASITPPSGYVWEPGTTLQTASDSGFQLATALNVVPTAGAENPDAWGTWTVTNAINTTFAVRPDTGVVSGRVQWVIGGGFSKIFGT